MVFIQLPEDVFSLRDTGYGVSKLDFLSVLVLKKDLCSFFLETRILTQSINLRQLLYLRHPQTFFADVSSTQHLGSRLVPPSG